MAVAIFAVVTIAATDEKDGDFDTVTARRVFVTNDAGKNVVGLSSSQIDNGLIWTQSAKGKNLVVLNSTVSDNGMVTAYQPNGKALVRLGSTGNGGLVEVTNNTGEIIGQIISDKDGNGVVSSANRKGDVRELKPGP